MGADNLGFETQSLDMVLLIYIPSPSLFHPLSLLPYIPQGSELDASHILTSNIHHGEVALQTVWKQ